MGHTKIQTGFPGLTLRGLVALLCAALLASGDAALLAQQAPPAEAGEAAEEAPVKLPPEQLDSLVAPIALYPDPLLAQTLAASTYPLELVQLSQWLEKHKDLKDKALADAVAKEPWDPSIQSMAAVPEVVKRLADDIQWTTQLGDAFLDQQGDVMDAVQRMRKKAEEKGALKSNAQQKVEIKVVEENTVIVVEPSNPEVVYVPSYSPMVVYGTPVYPYPDVYYPPYYPDTEWISFGVGMAVGVAIWGGSCCDCGWGRRGHYTIYNNYHNHFNRNRNANRGQGGGGGSGNWQHNSQHRGGAPYSNKATANRYGGSARGESAANRWQGGAGNRGGAGVSDRSGGGAGSRGGGAGVSDRSGGGAGSRGSSGGGFSGGGGDRVGGRDVSSGGGWRGGSSAFGGGSSGGFSGSSARSSSSRGSSSMGSRGGGGGSRGGGGRGGGRR